MMAVCGRFTQQASTLVLARLFGAEPVTEDAGGHYNVAPTHQVAAVAEHQGRRVITSFRWGLIPYWSQRPSLRPDPINARAETVATNASFREALQRRRCIIPAEAFYEWQGNGKTKTPYAIAHRDGHILAFAGLWESWREPSSGQRILSCTIVTTTANQTLRPIHERMPVILPPEAWTQWLDRAVVDPALVTPLLRPCADDLLQPYVVSTLVNRVRNDGPELLEPASPLATLF